MFDGRPTQGLRALGGHSSFTLNNREKEEKERSLFLPPSLRHQRWGLKGGDR